MSGPSTSCAAPAFASGVVAEPVKEVAWRGCLGGSLNTGLALFGERCGAKLEKFRSVTLLLAQQNLSSKFCSWSVSTCSSSFLQGQRKLARGGLQGFGQLLVTALSHRFQSLVAVLALQMDWHLCLLTRHQPTVQGLCQPEDG